MRFPLERRAMDFSISRLTLDTEAAALSAALFVVSASATLKVLRYTFLLFVTCATSQGNSLVFCQTPHSTAKAVATAPVCSHLTSCADMSAAPIHQRSTSIICGCKAGAPSGRASEPTVVILFQENFIFMVLLARSRGYSRPWFRRLHSKPQISAMPGIRISRGREVVLQDFLTRVKKVVSVPLRQSAILNR